MKILVTGAAGFIGAHTTKRLVELGHEVVAVDSLCDYYDPKYKRDRYKALVGDKATFLPKDISDLDTALEIFNSHEFDVVIHLAARGGVRASTKDPWTYKVENISGTTAILECMRRTGVKRIIMASSSSIYGDTQEVPFHEDQMVDFPVSIYAATKRANELLAYTYSYLYDINVMALRFFTVYGPWGRPDMAYFSFAEAMRNEDEISIYYSHEHGDLKRDFTYVDDVVDGIIASLTVPTSYQVVNVGKGSPDSVYELVISLEKHLGIKAKKVKKLMPPSDACITWADTTKAQKLFGYKPTITLDEGIQKFAEWYKKYYKM